jgi:hypothetical protein
VTTVARETTLDEIQVGIKRRLETIDGLRASATETERPNLPAAYPRLVSWVYSTVFEGQADWVFDVWVIVGIEPDLSRAQSTLNAYLAPSGRKSVKCAIEADPSLSGCVSFAKVVGGGDYGRLDIGGIAALGASVRVEVSV